MSDVDYTGVKFRSNNALGKLYTVSERTPNGEWRISWQERHIVVTTLATDEKLRMCFASGVWIKDESCSPQATIDTSRFPHKCVRCGSPAYISPIPGGGECSISGCK